MKITLYTYADKFSWSNEWTKTVSTLQSKSTVGHTMILLSTQVVDIDEPTLDGIDLVNLEVEEIQSLKKQFQASTQKQVKEFDEQIQSLLALPSSHEPVIVADRFAFDDSVPF